LWNLTGEAIGNEVMSNQRGYTIEFGLVKQVSPIYSPGQNLGDSLLPSGEMLAVVQSSKISLAARTCA